MLFQLGLAAHREARPVGAGDCEGLHPEPCALGTPESEASTSPELEKDRALPRPHQRHMVCDSCSVCVPGALSKALGQVAPKKLLFRDGVSRNLRSPGAISRLCREGMEAPSSPSLGDGARGLVWTGTKENSRATTSSRGTSLPLSLHSQRRIRILPHPGRPAPPAFTLTLSNPPTRLLPPHTHLGLPLPRL